MFELLRKMFASFISMVSNQKGVDVVEITDTTTSDLDEAIPEQWKIRCSSYSNVCRKTFGEEHGKPFGATRGKAK